jgi:hypothetical protein
MNNEELRNGLRQLGFDSGWVITGGEITFWENTEPQPTKAKILTAAGLYQKTLDDLATQRATDRAALLTRLGITADEAALLLQ